MSRDKGWNLLCKFFDNLGPIPHHMHQRDEDAARVGRRGKPEAYYFPPQVQPVRQRLSIHLHGASSRGRRKTTCRRCLENWNKGDNGILFLSRAFQLAARDRMADRSGHPACAWLARHLRTAGEQRRLRDVPIRGRRPHHRLEPADQGRVRKSAITISTTSSACSTGTRT